jgi:hypothetical protein
MLATVVALYDKVGLASPTPIWKEGGYGPDGQAKHPDHLKR